MVYDRPERTGRNSMATAIVTLHGRFFSWLENALSGWFTGLAARFVFASVLLLYYLNSAWGKFGEGPLGFLRLDAGAYVSVLPKLMEANNYDPNALAFFPYHLIVYLGTWAEFVLPILIVAGLFARIAAAGMIVFVAVQSYVDVAQHGLGQRFVGAMFDRLPDAIIWDQRLLWIFVLAMIVVAGPGRFSADHLLARRWVTR
jgi:putative oxidoreductase